MSMDVMSGFDWWVWDFLLYNLLVWVGSFMFLVVLFYLLYWQKGSRGEMIFSGACDVLSSTVSGAKMSAIGGSYLVVTSLFLLILFINLVGLLPYTFSVSSHMVFVLTFGFSFWFGLVSSSMVFGHVLTPMANLVFIGVGVLGGAILCWVEKLSIFLRVFTLSIRLVVNTAVGQAAFSLMGGLAVSYFFEGKGWLMLVVMAGVGLLMVEVAVSLIQAYLFCLLLSFYSNEHSV